VTTRPWKKDILRKCTSGLSKKKKNASRKTFSVNMFVEREKRINVPKEMLGKSFASTTFFLILDKVPQMSEGALRCVGKNRETLRCPCLIEEKSGE
jgi:hypothetical protein